MSVHFFQYGAEENTEGSRSNSENVEIFRKKFLFSFFKWGGGGKGTIFFEKDVHKIENCLKGDRRFLFHSSDIFQFFRARGGGEGICAR